LGSVSANVDQSPARNQQRLKRQKATEEPPVFDASAVSLCQNHYKCIPSLMILLTVEEEVFLHSNKMHTSYRFLDAAMQTRKRVSKPSLQPLAATVLL
jgi:hypothetical protein